MIASRAVAVASAIFTALCSGAPDSWIVGGTGSNRMCSGLKSTCNTVQTCTYHAYGPCGNATAPPVYIETEVVALALIEDGSAYLTDSSKLGLLEASSVSNNGYREMGDSKSITTSAGDATYAFFTSGAFFGTDPAKSGGYVGMAAYMVKTGDIATSTNTLVVPTEPGKVDVSDKTVCISDLTSGACGAKRTFSPGEYKFSLFGYTTGSEFKSGAAVKFLGIRTKMTLAGTTATLTINGDKTLDNIGSTDVAKITLTESAGTKRELTLEFPTKYNTGDTTTEGLATPSATKDVKIRVSKVSGDAQAIYVDYLFDALTAKDKYFIYDPTAKETTGDQQVVSKVTEMSLAFPLVVAVVTCLLQL